MQLLKLTDGALVDAPKADVLEIAYDHDLLRDAPSLDGVTVVRLDFPKFKDGRPFSQARLLRSRYGFQGEIRASGNLIPDQVHYARRVGFDTFELGDNQRIDDYRIALTSYQYAYQASSEGVPAYRLRGEGA